MPQPEKKEEKGTVLSKKKRGGGNGGSPKNILWNEDTPCHRNMMGRVDQSIRNHRNCTFNWNFLLLMSVCTMSK